MHIAQFDPCAVPAARGRLAGIAGLRGRGGGPQQLGDAADGDRGLLVAVEHLREHLHGREEHVDVEQVGDERARGQRAAAHLARRDQQHQRPGDGRQRLDEREVQRDVALGAEPGAPVVVAAPGEALRVAFLPAEGLGHPQAGHVLLQVGVDHAHLLPRVGVGAG